MNNATFAQRDLSVLWHPCTQMKDHESLPLISIKKGDGVFLEDIEGNRYIDAISSWWVNLFGHCNPTINNAIKQQLDILEHVMLGGFTHEAAVVLSEKLLAVAPQGLSKCFYSDNGSSAVEIALKMSFQSWRNQGNHQKTKFVSLENSYHGETLGALSVSNVALYKETFAPLLLDIISVPSPDCYHREQ
ncbi:MAG: aminotransferase class III-fold pyridoxal phosphate-dependent enzyme, partial [Methylococcales bacterium]|nr:aminotransferase class III-fold pyridoxal phosphate-dependent enzyme [Methylococcales bacterium]